MSIDPEAGWTCPECGEKYSYPEYKPFKRCCLKYLLNESLEVSKPLPGSLSEAAYKARGGPASVKKKGYA